MQQKGKKRGNKKKKKGFRRGFLWEEWDRRFTGFQEEFVRRRERKRNQVFDRFLGKAQRTGKGAIAAKTVQVRFLLLSEFLLIFHFSFWSFWSIQYFVDWCGWKGPQIILLKLVLYLFAMFFILLMPLIPSENNLHMCSSSDSMLEIAPFFLFKSYFESFPYFSPWISIWNRLFTLTNCFSTLSSPEFYYVFIYVLYPFSTLDRPVLVLEYLSMFWGIDKGGDMRDKM